MNLEDFHGFQHIKKRKKRFPGNQRIMTESTLEDVSRHFWDYSSTYHFIRSTAHTSLYILCCIMLYVQWFSEFEELICRFFFLLSHFRKFSLFSHIRSCTRQTKIAQKMTLFHFLFLFNFLKFFL
jgi:hypothetical protein